MESAIIEESKRSNSNFWVIIMISVISMVILVVLLILFIIYFIPKSNNNNSSILQKSRSYSSSQSIPVVKNVNIERYEGKWFEIAKLPVFFEIGCKNVTAEYTLDDNQVLVKNTCIRDNIPPEIANGIATPAPGITLNGPILSEGKLKLVFPDYQNSSGFPNFGDYWILKLDDNYQYALIGSPDYKTLYIIARNKTIPLEIYISLVYYATSLGYPTDKLEITIQE